MKRYNFTEVQGNSMHDMDELKGPFESDDGEWVRYEEVKTLIEERDRAQREGVEHYEALVDLVDERDAAIKFPPIKFPPEECRDFAAACNVMAGKSYRPDHWHLLAEKAEEACARGEKG